MAKFTPRLEWLSSLSAEDVCPLWGDLPDILFWIKDAQLRIQKLNSAFAERVQLPETDILGKTDADLYFPELAKVFMKDDLEVIRTGRSIHRKFELLANRCGGVEWRCTIKIPLRDKQGKIVGTTGISQPASTGKGDLPPDYAIFNRMVTFAQSRLGDGMDVPKLAQHVGISQATLQRRFQSHFGISPGEFLSQLRISITCQRLRESSLNITQIALESGYESPAAFSRAFRRQMGQSPREFKKSLQKRQNP